MNKRICTTLLAALTCLICAFSFSACDLFGGTSPTPDPDNGAVTEESNPNPNPDSGSVAEEPDNTPTPEPEPEPTPEPEIKGEEVTEEEWIAAIEATLSSTNITMECEGAYNGFLYQQGTRCFVIDNGEYREYTAYRSAYDEWDYRSEVTAWTENSEYYLLKDGVKKYAEYDYKNEIWKANVRETTATAEEEMRERMADEFGHFLTVDFSAVEGEKAKPLTELYSAFTYDDGIYYADLYVDGEFEMSVELSFIDGYVERASSMQKGESETEEGLVEDIATNTFTFKYGIATITFPPEVNAAMENAEIRN